MQIIERLSYLLCCNTVDDWRNRVFTLGNDLGYEQTLLAIFPNRQETTKAESAFLHSHYSSDWLNKYTANEFHHFDPIFSHCTEKSTPLIWSPNIFSNRRQKEMYEEASAYGIKSGVTLPIHGAKGELGIMCFVSDTKPDKRFSDDANSNLPQLSYLRDFILESSLKFINSKQKSKKMIPVSTRELECLKWCAAGKSSWEIGQILNCSEANVNYHFGNIHYKFGTNSRQQAIARAIRLGLINPA
jgi:LuxR family quorum-sensing transcriptional regulator LasR